MDMKMPLMDGLEATEKIREFRKDMLIIGLSSYVFNEFKLKALKEGCNDYITKPLTEENLIKVINRNIDK
jgi:CheY-like chemotaxis protein